MSKICLVNSTFRSITILTWWQLEGDGEAIVRSGSFRPLQFGVEGIQHIELHWLEEAVALVLKDDRHHNFALILMVALDIVHLGKKDYLSVGSNKRGQNMQITPTHATLGSQRLKKARKTEYNKPKNLIKRVKCLRYHHLKQGNIYWRFKSELKGDCTVLQHSTDFSHSRRHF